MKTIWIVRKHPPHPYTGIWTRIGHLEAFTIHGQYRNRVEAKEAADNKNNKRSNYLYSVYGLKVKEFT